MNRQLLLSIDQGTTSTRALVFDRQGRVAASSSQDLTQYYPQDGWVEHDAEEIWTSSLAVAREAVTKVGAETIAAIGIANQRETTLIWDKASGQALHHAIVWQDRRTGALCDALVKAGREPAIQAKTGLIVDPYFSGTKLAWLLETVPGARARAEAGELAFGTVDSWLIRRLTGDARHVTDVTNASRTLLYNIRELSWDEDLLRWLAIPASVLPQVVESAAPFGVTQREFFGAEIPILGVAGDQQAAALGQACLTPGEVKATYGTGCFMLMNTGGDIPHSEHRLLGTIASRLDGRTSYALEGSIFMAGAVLDWLKAIGIVDDVAQVGALAAQASANSRAILVPGFTGLGAPYWSSEARGALLGMTRDTGAAEIAAAALDAVAFQTRDLLEAMRADTGLAIETLRVDGGMTKSVEFLQRLADLTGVEVVRAATSEATALGAAYLAGLKAGLLGGLDEIARLWRADATFAPPLGEAERDARYEDWQAAVRRTL